MKEEIKIENIRPVGSFVLIEPVNRPEETSSGFIIPEEGYTPTPVIGKIIAVGEASIYKEGDMVFFRRYSIDELKFNTGGTQQIVSLISDDEIVATIQNNA